MSLAYLLTVIYARGGRMQGQWPADVLSTAALALVIAAGYVLNDVFDYAVDRLNSPQRPLPSGRVSRRAAGVAGAVLLLLGLTLAAMCRWQYLIVLGIVAAALVVYDLYSKQFGVIKQLLVAALMTSIYPLAVAQTGWPTGSRAGSLAVFSAWLLLTSFGYEVLKDIRDARGDALATGRSLPLHHNRRRWRIIAEVLIIAAAPLLVGPYLLGCQWVYMTVASVAMVAAVASALLPVRWALRAVYAECFLVGVAATADVLIFGF